MDMVTKAAIIAANLSLSVPVDTALSGLLIEDEELLVEIRRAFLVRRNLDFESLLAEIIRLSDENCPECSAGQELNETHTCYEWRMGDVIFEHFDSACANLDICVNVKMQFLSYMNDHVNQ